MEHVARQLEQVRQTGRWLLVTQRLMQWAAVLTAAGIGLGLIDFALRLPGWLRLVIGLAVVGAAATWLVTRIGRALRFWPSLGELALRAEHMYPQLAGSLASAVEFTVQADEYRDPQRTAAFAGATVSDAASRLEGVRLMKLIDLSRTARVLIDMFAALAVLTVLVIVAPQQTQIAAARWVAPLGSAQWPKRTDVESRVAETVWPTDSPLRLRASVGRGHYDGMRVWVTYRLVDAEGEKGQWQSLLMNEQSGQPGTFERLIDLPPALVRAVNQSAAANKAAIEFRFEAGDDQTEAVALPLVARPVVQRITASFTPPAYAAGLISEQTMELHEQTTPIATAAALVGSQVGVEIELNKPIPHDALDRVAPGIDGAEVAVFDDARFILRFPLRQTVETPIMLVDEFGLKNHSERRYRIEAIEDKPPTVSIVDPSADESVLPTAVLGVEALAQDDVGMRRLSIEAEVPNIADSGSDQTTVTKTLSQRDVRQAIVSAETRLDLEPFALRPGQVVVLSATARDVFHLDGAGHDPVRSPVRRLRIIDEATLISQFRTELAALRQQAIRLEQAQRQLHELSPLRAQPAQAQLTRRLETQASLLNRLQQRAQINRLDEPALDELMVRASKLIAQAENASTDAERHLRRGQAQPARETQERVGESLRELISLLDQGRDALTLQLALRQLKTQQENVTQDTRQMLPRTVGQKREDLSDPLREQLDTLGERQAALADQAEKMIRQMQSTAEALSRQSESDHDQAAAEALAEAAAIAQRQGLGQKMRQASGSTDQNQLSQAGQQQADALDTLRQMLAQMEQQDRLRQAILRRRLRKLVRALEKLILRQTGQIAALEVAESIAPLEPGQSALRRSTMAAQAQAEGSAKTQAVAAVIDEAVGDQADAIISLRQRERQPANIAENKALVHLEEALEQVRKLNEQAQQDAAAQERAELRQAYEELAAQQDALVEQTSAIADIGPITRRQRAALTDLGQRQQDVRDTASELGEKIDNTLVFKRLHRRLDESAMRVVNALRRGVAGGDVLLDQTQVAVLLHNMAEALADDPSPQKFAESEASDASGGGGGSMAGEMIPPIAELKLLRGVQDSIYESTRQFGGSPLGAHSATIRGRLLELSTRQKELSELGTELIEHMMNTLQQPNDTETSGPQ